jgi:hypothetical protein
MIDDCGATAGRKLLASVYLSAYPSLYLSVYPCICGGMAGPSGGAWLMTGRAAPAQCGVESSSQVRSRQYQARRDAARELEPDTRDEWRQLKARLSGLRCDVVYGPALRRRRRRGRGRGGGHCHGSAPPAQRAALPRRLHDGSLPRAPRWPMSVAVKDT